MFNLWEQSHTVLVGLLNLCVIYGKTHLTTGRECENPTHRAISASISFRRSSPDLSAMLGDKTHNDQFHNGSPIGLTFNRFMFVFI